MKDELNVDMTRGITRWFAQEKNYFPSRTWSISPYSTASQGLKYLGRLMSFSISSTGFPTPLDRISS